MKVFWFALACLGAAKAFNVDVDSCVRHHAPRKGSMFGFTVQEHVENGMRMVLVGAPQDDNRRRPGVYRPGTVYQCSITTENECTEVVFDYSGNNNDTKSKQIDEKSNQWFGATLVSTGVDGHIVACAPRYVSFVSASLNLREPVGTCFVAKNSFRDVVEYSPCRTYNYGYHRTGVCQAGFGAAVTKDGSRLFMGAPGSYYWQGQIYSQSLSSRPMMLATAESPSSNDDSYLGYSVTVGDFSGSGEQGVAVGMPRGANLRGKVVMSTWNLENIKNVSGSQIGAYFGYSVAAGDIDGDGLDDLIVGAPMYTVPNNEGAFEQGRVYVIYQGRAERPFKLNHFRTGEVSRGRFGLSVASLGDIDLDSFGDFAVGAPYGGQSGRGAVYLFYGSKDGVREKYSQVITAEEVEPSMSTFGFSLSGGIDMDGNNYNDLVVGAYKSDAAVFFKARPVVKVTANVNLGLGRLSKEISLDDTKCSLHSGLKVACMDVTYCLIYDGINVDDRIEFEISLTLDSLKKKSRRMFFLNDESNHMFHRTVTINRNQHWCGDSKVYILPEVRDKLTPLQVTMEYNLRKDISRSDHIAPVLNLLVGNSASDAVNINKNCGPDKICIPNLKMSVEPTVAKYLLGSQEKLGINVFVENIGEDAFEATYYIRIPPGVHFVKTERLETGKTEANVICSEPTADNDGNSTLKCDIGNPLPSQQMVNFKVVLQPYDIDSTTQKYVFSMEVNSTNPETEQSRFDNSHTLSVGVWVDTNVSVIGVSIPPELHYNASLYQIEEDEVISKDTEFGPHVVHAYSVKNNGPSIVEEAELFIIWPYQTLAGEDLFYLMAQAETSGNIQCGMTDHMNERLFSIDSRNQQFFLPQIIRSLETNKEVSFNESQAFSQTQYSSDEMKRKFEIEQQKQRNQFASASNSQSGTEQKLNTYNTNSATSQGSHYNQQGSAYVGNNNQFNKNSRGSQYGSTNQHGSTSSQSDNTGSRQNVGEYGTSSSSASGHSASSGQFHTSSNQNVGSNSHYGESSNQYGGTSNQYGGVGQGSARGAGHGYNIYKERNTTIDIDEHGHVRKTETSTEYRALGHEGEAGSSWNNRQGNYYGGSSGYNRQGGFNQQGSHDQQASYNKNQASASANRNSNQNLGWSTEESVNKNLFNAGSRTSVQSSQDYNGIEEVVGGEEEQIGGLAIVAGNPDHEFRTVWGAVDNAASSGSSSSASRSSTGSMSGYGTGSISGSGQQSGTRYSEQSYGSGGAYSSGAGSRSETSSSGRASQSGYASSREYASSAQSGSSYHESKQFSKNSASGYSSESAAIYGRPANYQQQWNHRSKRQTYADIDKDVDLVLANCTNNFKCAIIRCVTGPLQKNQEVWASLQGRINAKFLNEMSKDREVIVTTVAAARVSRLPHIGKPVDATLTTFQAVTHITPQVETPSSGSVPLWVVVLAAVAGALLLLLLIFLLYKCGFFKRNRPTDQAERQPLNRNGYHGDEHL